MAALLGPAERAGFLCDLTKFEDPMSSYACQLFSVLMDNL